MTHLNSGQQLSFVVLPDDYRMNPGPFMAESYARHGPIFRSRTWDGQEVIYFVGPEAMRHVLVTKRDQLSNEEGWLHTEKAIGVFGKGLTFMDGQEHARHRRAMSPVMTPKALEASLPIINQAVQERLAAWQDRPSVDIYAEAHRLTFDVASETLLGITSPSQRNRYRELYHRGEFARAIPLLQRLIEVAEMGSYDRVLAFSSHFLGEDAYLNLAVCYHRLAKLDEAERWYRRLLALNPQHQGASQNLRLLQEHRQSLS